VKRLLITDLITGLIIGIGLCPLGWAWDGDWTHAHSGKVGLFDDPGSSDGKSGTDPPQKYYKANPRDFVDVDPEELDDYFNRYKKEYSPYALARITQNIRYNNVFIPKGYYLIKPGDINDGSPRISLKNVEPPTELVAPNAVPIGRLAATQPVMDEIPAVDTETLPPMPPSAYPETPSPPSPPATGNTLKSGEPVYQVFVIKKLGKVVAVVPINRMEIYKPKRKEHVPKHALAWLEQENRRPVLKFYYRKRLYSTEFQ